MNTRATDRIVPAILAVLTMGLASVQAAPIFTDDFTTAGTGGWYKGDETAGSLTNSGGALVFGSGAQNGQDILARSFDATTLTVGETLRLTFDYKIDAGTGKIFRVGLFDTANAITANGFTDTGNAADLGDYDGYYTFFRDNQNTGNAARFQDETMIYQTQYWPTSSGTTIGDNTTQYDMVNGTPYSVVFDVTKTSATQTDTLLTFNSADGSTTHMSLAGTTTANIQDSFDAVVIRTGGSDATIDNVSVEVLGGTAAPMPVTVAISILDASSAAISWGATNGAFYTVEASSNLLDGVSGWNTVMSNIPGIYGELSFTNAIGNDQRFYRVITEE